MGGFAAERPADWRYGSIAARRSAAGARAAGASVLRRVRNSRTIIITNNGAANVGSVVLTSETEHMLEGIRQNIYWFSSRNGG